MLSDSTKPASVVNPPVVLNKYLWAKLKEIDPNLSKKYMVNGKEVIPFFPVADNMAGDIVWKDRPYLVYNVVFDKPFHPFYIKKRETVHYGIKGTPAEIMEWSRTIHMIFDRHDDAAKDVNSWNRAAGQDKVFFHDIRVFSVDTPNSRDYVNQPHVTAELMVRYNYHYLGYGY